jgi:hypothetical protein
VVNARGQQLVASKEESMATANPFSLDDARRIAGILGIDFATSPFPVEEFHAGLGVELEHGRRDAETNVTGDDPETTGKIALAHLREIPDYYTRLAIMEADAEG